MIKSLSLVVVLVLLSLVNGQSFNYTDNCVNDIIRWKTEMYNSLNAFGPVFFPASRENAINAIAIHDSLNLIDRQYKKYYNDYEFDDLNRGEISHANPCAAVFSAWRTAANNHTLERLTADSITPYYGAAVAGQWISKVDEFYNGGINYLRSNIRRHQSRRENRRVDDGITLGAAVAQSILERRWNDGWNKRITFPADNPSPAPGQWYNTYPGSTPLYLHWADVQTFVVQDKEAVLATPPPSISSQQFTDADLETKTLGRIDSTVRTPAQSAIARFWGDYTAEQVSKIIAEVSTANDYGIYKTAHLLVLGNVGQADGLITNVHSKTRYNYFRPIHSIANKPITVDYSAYPNIVANQDSTWRSYIFMPNNQEYPAGHSQVTSSGLYAVYLAEGRDTVKNGPITVDYINNVRPQVFTTYSQMLTEVGLARIYGGIHRRFSTDQGRALGTRIAQQIYARFTKTNNNDDDRD